MEKERWDHRRFASWVRAELRRREWNQSDFAKRIGVPQGTVSRWLDGARRPSPSSADRIADVFGVDVDLVLTLAGHRPATVPLRPDDPKTRIIDLVKRADLGYGRAEGLEDMLRGWIEYDRAASRGPRASGGPGPR